MKILYITECFPFGKGEAFISSEIKEMQNRGHEIVIVPLRIAKQLVHEDAALFVPLTHIESGFSLNVFLSAIRALFSNFYIVFKYLFLFLTQSKFKNRYRNLQCFLKSLWLVGLVDKLKIDHIHAHWATCTSTMAMVASDATSVPWSFTAHRYDIVENNLLEKKMAAASFSRFISQSGLDITCQLIGNTYIDKACVLHMGVSIPTTINAGHVNHPFVLFCPANFVEVKGHRYLIDAIKIIKNSNAFINIELWLAGTGELYQEMLSYTQDGGLTHNIKFLGQLSHAQLINLYEQAKVDGVVLPSIDLGRGHHEGIPVSLMEAMSYAIPVISTKTGGIPELLNSGVGLMVKDKNPKELAEAIIFLFTMSNEERNKLANSGRQKVIQSFSILSVVSELEYKMSCS